MTVDVNVDVNVVCVVHRDDHYHARSSVNGNWQGIKLVTTITSR